VETVTDAGVVELLFDCTVAVRCAGAAQRAATSPCAGLFNGEAG
jgi:hypothetical protein